jgi:diadenosine tetraphosphate (Ap4A) HIT family hydrolase
VPDRKDITEIHQLDRADQQQLMGESCALAHCLAMHWRADKINIAALGNVVPQLHMRHIVRYHHDPAWPAPVWGWLKPEPYTETARNVTVDRLRRAMAGDGGLTV